MAWPFSTRAAALSPSMAGDASDQVGRRTAARRTGAGPVSRKRALTHSAVWACRRLRADLISSMPVDVFRRVQGVQVAVPTPPVLIRPDGKRISISSYLYSSQNDLDDCGNAISIIRGRDGLGFPAVLEPKDVGGVVVRVRDGVVTYAIEGKIYQEHEVFHEVQNPVSGTPVGLGVLGAAAASLNSYLSAQEFAAAWFSGQAIPASTLKNTKRALNPDEARTMKERFKASLQDGDVFVTGADWDFSLQNGPSASSAFLDERRFGIADVCRFYSVPGDMIDAPSNGSSVTYANVTQRNLQLMIVNLGPAVKRREDKLSELTPSPRFVKLNRSAVLAMDVAGRYASYGTAIDKRFMAPSEVRELENLPPFTPDQLAEFGSLPASPQLVVHPGGNP